LAARSRYAKDELHSAIKRGVHQYVILGAGLDTFAYRNPYPEDVVHVFEVDHPDTQNWKHTRQALFCICMIIRIIKAAIDSIVSLCYLCVYETIVGGICSRMLTGLCEYDIE